MNNDINKVFVSVIVPMYNKESTIIRCLESLSEQKLKELEIIVIDDGSTDKSKELVEKYQKRDNRIKLISQENRGPGAARNVGIKAASGEYIGFVDCDDKLDSRMYEAMYCALQKTKSSVAVCQEKNVFYEKDGRCRVLSETHFPYKEITVCDREQMLDWFLNFKYLSLNSACFKLVKKSIFTEHNIWFPEDYRYAEDLTISGGIFSVAQRVAIVPESLYIYIHDTGTFSTSYTIKKAQDVLEDLKDVLRYLKKIHYTGTVDNFILGMSFSSIRQIYGTEKKQERESKEAKELISTWKKMKKHRRPRFRGKKMPVFHKMKVLVAWMHMEAFTCKIINLLSGVPFFRFMV